MLDNPPCWGIATETDGVADTQRRLANSLAQAGGRLERGENVMRGQSDFAELRRGWLVQEGRDGIAQGTAVDESVRKRIEVRCKKRFR